MVPVPERAPPGGLGRVLVAGVALLLLAPVALFATPGDVLRTSVGILALPLAALSIAAPPRGLARALPAAAAAGLAAWWLLASGTLPDQTVRTAALVASLAFVGLGLVTRWSLIHRAIAAVGGAALAVGALYLLVGRSWDALHWWSTYRASYGMQLRLAPVWAVSATEGGAMAGELAGVFGAVVRVVSDLFPALVVLHLLAALALATAVHRRLAGRSVGRPPDPFRTFRFSEHLGWFMVAPLIVVLLPKLAAAKLAAWNVLTVMGVLYATRGLAVAAFGLQLIGSGMLIAVLAALAVIFLLPVLATALVLGVLDTGFDFRRRWTAPRNS